MDVIARTVIPRHAVPEVLVGGDRLSPMQAALLETDSVCTVAGAPTGAGKSFVFRRAVERGERVLFVVPTRRLAENQAAGIRADLRDAGWPERDVAEKVAMFTSDESARLRASGVTRITLHRLAKLPQLRPNERGEIIFATPEAVSWLLMHPHMGDGLGDVGAATLMRSFDRLVFDEFHLIQPRGFGLVSLCAGLAAHGPWRDGKDGNRSRAKVSLLSATPLDIRPVMRRLGVPLERSDIIDETIVEDGGRVLHGDVTLEFAVAESPLELARELAPEIGALPDGQVAVVLYDALKDLQRDLDGLLDLAERLDLLGSERFFVDSSLDAQRDAPWCGRGKPLDGRKLIAATSTLEVGVTLKGLKLLVMDPGFTPMSFLQRFGRVARGDYDGRVVVRVTKDMKSQRPWLARLIAHVQESGGRIGVTGLSAFMAGQARIAKRFTPPEDAEFDAMIDAAGADRLTEDGMDCFDTLSVRAAFASGMYWTLLVDRMRNAGKHGEAAQVARAAPSTAGIVRGWLDEISNGRLEGGAAWRRAFEEESGRLRDFSPSVTVVGTDGQSFVVSEAWLTKQTTLLQEYPVTMDTKGNTLVRVDEQVVWERFLREKGDRGAYTRQALLPYKKRCQPVGRAPVEEFARHVQGLTVELSGSRMKIAERAISLVTATGVVPYDDDAGCAAAASGIV